MTTRSIDEIAREIVCDCEVVYSPGFSVKQRTEMTCDIAALVRRQDDDLAAIEAVFVNRQEKRIEHGDCGPPSWGCHSYATKGGG